MKISSRYQENILRMLSLLSALGALFCGLLFPLSAVDAGARIRFSDVGEKSWYRESVYAVCDSGLMVGTADTVFSPEKNITTAECITLLARIHARTLEKQSVLQKMSAGNAPWYAGYYQYCTAQGLLSSTDAEKYRKNSGKTVTREEMLVIFSTLPMQLFAQINSVPDNSIPDVKMTRPTAEIIYRAYRSGIVNGTDASGRFCSDQTITRAETAAIIVRLVNPENRIFKTDGAQSVLLYAADGSSKKVVWKDAADDLAQGWRETPYPVNAVPEQLLDTVPLTPVKTGYEPLDTMIDAVFADILTDDMTTSQKIRACYDYLVKNCSYGTSPVSGNYRKIYKSNPYVSPDPARICHSAKALSGDRGYSYFYTALADHALEAYTIMYAAEMLDGHIGWCDHYSSAFAVMMRRLGLPCFPIYVNSKLGSTYKPHMTTVMTVGGVDCIFDPQIEAVLTASSGKNQYKRYCRPLSSMQMEYRDFDNLEDCRNLFGPFLTASCE